MALPLILADEEAHRKALKTSSETLAREMGPVREGIRASDSQESSRKADTPSATTVVKFLFYKKYM